MTLLSDILDGLRRRRDDEVFVGIDRIGGDEFADLVYTMAGGLRARNAASLALVGRPGPATVAFVLAAVGTGTRVDLFDPYTDEELLTAQLEAAVPWNTVADVGMAQRLRGPRWLAKRLGLPNRELWPEVIALDSISGAQQRRFGPDDDAPALTLFHGAAEPLGVVHSVASLSAGIEALAGLLPEDGPLLTDSYAAALAAISRGIPVLPARPKAKSLERQHRRAGSSMLATEPATITYTSQARREAEFLWMLPSLFPVARFRDGGGQLLDGVEARAEDGLLHLHGSAMAPKNLDGEPIIEVATGVAGGVSGREIWFD